MPGHLEELIIPRQANSKRPKVILTLISSLIWGRQWNRLHGHLPKYLGIFPSDGEYFAGERPGENM